MDVAMQGFYAQRIEKERRAKDHFDKVVHLHQQAKMAASLGSGHSKMTACSSNTDIIRNRLTTN